VVLGQSGIAISACQHKSAEVVLWGPLHAYSTAHVPSGGFILGGWLDASDVNDYLSAKANGADARMLPGPDCILWWPGYGLARVALSVIGRHINDPSVVEMESGILFMYHISLENVDAREPEMFDRNSIGLATSTDGGATWHDRGVIVPYLAVPTGGAWAPAAVRVASEIWLYCHSGRGGVYRLRLALDGSQWLSTPDQLGLSWFVNPSVTTDPDGRFVMLANDPSLYRIYRLTSTDGLVWTDPEQLIDGSGAGLSLIAPSRVDSADTLEFALDSGDGAHSIHRWSFHCAD